MGLDLFHAIPSAKTDDTLEYFIQEEFASNPTFFKNYSHLHELIFDIDNPSAEKIKGLYWITKGVQRKGMNKLFYEDFINCKLYLQKKDVLRAYSYLEPTWAENIADLRKHFVNNFIDNFIEGESIFFASW